MIDPIAPQHGFPALLTADEEGGARPPGSHAMIGILDRSGLRGRGGAGFPAATKWRSVAARARGHAVVLVNGVEADPLSTKDRWLLEHRAPLVLDGALLAAESVGAASVVIAINRRFSAAHAAVASTIKTRRRSLPVALVQAPSRYVAGEESALVRFVNGGEARPTVVPPRPYERGVRGRPTLVSNVETLAWAALIARRGEHWFQMLGSPSAPGAVLLTVAGAVRRPGLYEVGAHMTVPDVITAAGGPDGRLQAVLHGGYFGVWSSPLETHALVDHGGMVLALSTSSCGLTETARMLSLLAGESARQCGPCFSGLPALSTIFAALALGRAQRADVDRLWRWAGQLAGGRGACHHPDGAVALLRSALTAFADDVEVHLQQGGCGREQAPSVLPVGAMGEGWR